MDEENGKRVLWACTHTYTFFKEILFIKMNLTFSPSRRLSFSRWDTLEDVGLKRVFGAPVLASIRSTTDKSTSVLNCSRKRNTIHDQCNTFICYKLTCTLKTMTFLTIYITDWLYRYPVTAACLCVESPSPGRPLAAPCWPLLQLGCFSALFLQPGKGIWSLQTGQQVA